MPVPVASRLQGLWAYSRRLVNDRDLIRPHEFGYTDTHHEVLVHHVVNHDSGESVCQVFGCAGVFWPPTSHCATHQPHAGLPSRACLSRLCWVQPFFQCARCRHAFPVWPLTGICCISPVSACQWPFTGMTFKLAVTFPTLPRPDSWKAVSCAACNRARECECACACACAYVCVCVCVAGRPSGGHQCGGNRGRGCIPPA